MSEPTGQQKEQEPAFPEDGDSFLLVPSHNIEYCVTADGTGNGTKLHLRPIEQNNLERYPPSQVFKLHHRRGSGTATVVSFTSMADPGRTIDSNGKLEKNFHLWDTDSRSRNNQNQDFILDFDAEATSKTGNAAYTIRWYEDESWTWVAPKDSGELKNFYLYPESRQPRQSFILLPISKSLVAEKKKIPELPEEGSEVMIVPCHAVDRCVTATGTLRQSSYLRVEKQGTSDDRNAQIIRIHRRNVRDRVVSFSPVCSDGDLSIDCNGKNGTNQHLYRSNDGNINQSFILEFAGEDDETGENMYVIRWAMDVGYVWVHKNGNELYSLWEDKDSHQKFFLRVPPKKQEEAKPVSVPKFFKKGDNLLTCILPDSKPSSRVSIDQNSLNVQLSHQQEEDCDVKITVKLSGILTSPRNSSLSKNNSLEQLFKVTIHDAGRSVEFSPVASCMKSLSVRDGRLFFATNMDLGLHCGDARNKRENLDGKRFWLIPCDDSPEDENNYEDKPFYIVSADDPDFSLQLEENRRDLAVTKGRGGDETSGADGRRRFRFSIDDSSLGDLLPSSYPRDGEVIGFVPKIDPSSCVTNCGAISYGGGTNVELEEIPSAGANSNQKFKVHKVEHNLDELNDPFGMTVAFAPIDRPGHRLDRGGNDPDEHYTLHFYQLYVQNTNQHWRLIYHSTEENGDDYYRIVRAADHRHAWELASKTDKVKTGFFKNKDEADNQLFKIVREKDLKPPPPPSQYSDYTENYNRLKRFYNKYAPEKISNVETALDKFKGNEKKMFEILVMKYGPEPSASGNDDDDDQQQQQSRKENNYNAAEESLSEDMKTNIKTMFNIFDVDGSGFLEGSEIIAAMTTLFPHESLTVILRHVALADTNKDGKLSLQEFTLVAKDVLDDDDS